jgi:acetyl-CoA carboxylase carboxyltransferase component
MGYFQGVLDNWRCADQAALRDMVPENRRRTYPVRRIIETLADEDSFMELRPAFGQCVVTGFMRLEGRPVGLIANDCMRLSGAVDSASSDKAARFVQLCDAYELPIVSLIDTPGFMVGPESEEEAAVRRMSRLFVSAANATVPIVAIFLRRGYGLGAMAMAGGGFHSPVYSASWPTGEFGGMGLEGAVRLGFKKELEAVEDEAEREKLYEYLLAIMYELGKATEAAAHLEIDAVIDPADTRKVILRALSSAPDPKIPHEKRHRFVDTW